MQATQATRLTASGSSFKWIFLAALELLTAVLGSPLDAFSQDPFNVELVTRTRQIWQGARAIYFIGDTAVLETERGVAILDVSNPSQPRELSFLATKATCSKLAIYGSYLYVGINDAGLQIADVSDVLHPVWVNSIAQPAFNLTIMGSTLIVGSGVHGLQLYTLEDPVHPSLVGNYNDRQAWSKFVLRDSLIYLPCGTYGLAIIDISDPRHPIEISACGDTLCANSIVIEGEYLYILDGWRYGDDNWSGLWIVNIADPEHPSVIKGIYIDLQLGIGISIVNHRLWIRNSTEPYLEIFDISDPTNPESIYHLDYTSMGGMFMHNDYLFSPEGGNGLVVFDVNPIDSIREIGRLSSPMHVWNVTGSGNLAYVSEYDGGITILDLINPQEPVRIGGFDTHGLTKSTQLVGNTLYLSDVHFWDKDTSGVVILDVSDPSNPRQLSQYRGSGLVRNSYDLAANDSIMLLTGYDGPGLKIFDVSDPQNPRLAVQQATTDNHVDIVGNLAFLTDSRGMRIVDITRMQEPTEIGRLDLDGGASGVEVDNQIAAVFSENGLHLIDVENPAQPVVLGNLNLGDVQDMLLQNGILFVIDRESGLQIFNIGNPQVPYEIGSYSGIEFGQSVALAGGTILVAERTGLGIYRYISENSAPIHQNPLPTATVLLSAYPNPFNGVSNISFSLPGDDVVDIGVFNLRGELTERLFNGHISAGSHQLDWNARNAPTGVYWVRIKTGSGFTASERAVLIK